MTCRGGTADGVVLECRWGRGGGGKLFEGGVECSYGGDAAGGFEAGGGPAVEGEAGAGCFFGVVYVPVLFLHCYWLWTLYLGLERPFIVIGLDWILLVLLSPRVNLKDICTRHGPV